MPRGSKAESLAELLAQLPEELRRQAFTHASWVEHRSDSYERLAFLGDVVLSLAVSTHLFPRFERYGAGRLTKVRAQAVSGASCARVALGLGVPDALREAAPMIASQIDASTRSEATSISALRPVVPSGAAARSESGTPSPCATRAQEAPLTAWARTLVRRPAP